MTPPRHGRKTSAVQFSQDLGVEERVRKWKMVPGDVPVPVCKELAHTESALSLARLSFQSLASSVSQKEKIQVKERLMMGD